MFFFNIQAQQTTMVLIAENEQATKRLYEIIKVDEIPAAALIAQKERLLEKLYGNGFIEAGIDSVSIVDNKMIYHFFLGKRYEWGKLEVSPEVLNALAEVGYRDISKNKIFDYQKITEYFEAIIKYYENRGYPFAMVQLERVKIEDERISAMLMVDKGNYYQIDTIIVNNNDIVSSDFIQKTIDIKQGEAYQDRKIHNIKSRINNLEFIEMGDDFNLHFDTVNAWINFSIKKRKSNSFDGIIGFYSDDKTGKLAYNGNLNLQLMNSFKTGETLKFSWLRPKAGNQSIHLFYSQPYLLHSHFGADYSFRLYREDSSYTNVLNKPTLAYRFSGDDNISVYATHFLSQISPFYEDTIRKGFSSLSFGIGFTRNRLDYKLNPRAGFKITYDMEAGKKTIKAKEANVQQLSMESIKAKLVFKGEIFFPVFHNSTILLSNQSSFMLNANLLENELFRIGGFKTLRGFDEESIYASSFSIADLEYRILIQRNSNISIFYNLALVEKNTNVGYENTSYQGFGAGISFDTGSGILSLFYALGKKYGNQIVFQNSKIHFGYVAKF